MAEHDSRYRFGVAVAAGFVLLAFIAGRFTAPDGSAPLPPPAERGMTSPAADPSEASAVAAATEHARVMASVSGTTASYLEQAVAIAAPDWEDRASELARGAADFIVDRYGSDASVDFEPLRYRVQSHSSESAVVDVWGVVLATGSKVGGIEESWVTGTLDVVWTGSEWKVAGQSSSGGPTPELLRTEDQGTADEILNEFSEYHDAPES